MPFLAVILFLFSHSLLLAEQSWLGVILDPRDPQEQDAATLPEGFGMKVREVLPGGPLSETGIREGDILWKLNEQILVNRGQAAVLMATMVPGQEIEVTFRQNGLDKTSMVVLGKRPTRRNPEGQEARPISGDDARLTRRELLVQMDKEGKGFSLSTKEDGLIFEVSVEEKVVHTVHLSDPINPSQVPAEWSGHFDLLRSTLEEQGRKPMRPTAKRVRYVPRTKTASD